MWEPLKDPYGTLTGILTRSLKGILKGTLKGLLKGPLNGILKRTLKGILKRTRKGILKGTLFGYVNPRIAYVLDVAAAQRKRKILGHRDAREAAESLGFNVGFRVIGFRL